MAFSIVPFLSIDAVGSELLARLLEYIDCDTHQRTPKNSSIKLSNAHVFDIVGVSLFRASSSYLLLVASVGPEALVALHEYINGGTEGSVFDNSSGTPR